MAFWHVGAIYNTNEFELTLVFSTIKENFQALHKTKIRSE